MRGWRGVVAGLLLAWTATLMAAPDLAALQQQVFAAERAFARSMADRKFDDFVRHLSEQAVFWDSRNVQRGKAEVAARWKAFYEGPQAPFSWEPDGVEVSSDGLLAHSTGPVRDASGKLVSRFNSVWRQEAPGVWRVVFDKGSPLTEAEKALPAGGKTN
jgi:ketosteroid isomerase-like protein